jgi:hypothetical protein
MTQLRQATILCAAFFLLGVGLLAAAGFFIWQTCTFIRDSKVATGRVVKLEWRDGLSGRHGSGGGYVAVFTFTDGSGQTRTVRAKSGRNPPRHEVGAVVVVLFPPEDPDQARIRSFDTLWLVPTVLFCFGLGFSVVGGYGFLAARRTYGEFLHDQTA